MKEIVLTLLFATGLMSAQAQTDVSFFVVAHPDDWQLFMGANAAHDILNGANSKVVIIHTAAGDAAWPNPGYYQSRFIGVRKAVQFCADINSTHSTWSFTTVNMNGHPLSRQEYKNVVVYTLLIPDANNAVANLNNNLGPVTALDGSTTYLDRADLVKTLKDIFIAESNGIPNKFLNLPDPDNNTNPGDHPTHQATGALGIDASRAMYYATCHLMDIWLFEGYNTKNKPSNLSPDDIALKGGLFGMTDYGRTENGWYSTFVFYNGDDHIKWVSRQYATHYNYGALDPCSGKDNGDHGGGGPAGKHSDPGTETSQTQDMGNMTQQSKDKQKLEVYPNPADDNIELSFSLEQDGLVWIELFDLSGRRFGLITYEKMNTGVHKLSYNIKRLPPGTYNIIMKTATDHQSYQLIRK